MPAKKINKKVVPKKAQIKKRAVSAVKKSSKKITKKIPKKKVVKKKVASKKVVKKNLVKKVVKKPTNKVTKKVISKNKKIREVVAKKVAKKEIKDLIQDDLSQDLELKLFETPTHFLPENEEIEAPKLFAGDTVEKTKEVIINNIEATHVTVKQSRQSKWSQNILDLSELDSSEVKEKQAQDTDAFIISSTEDGFWKTVDIFMKGESEMVSSHEQNKVNGVYNFLNLSIVSWVVYVLRMVFIVLNPVIRLFSDLVQFVIRSLREYILTLFSITRLFFRGRLNRDNILNPEQAFVDVSLFDNITKPRLQFAFNLVAVRSLALFMILSVVIVLPVKGMALIDVLQKQKQEVLGVSENAYSSLQSGLEDIQQFAWLAASDHFQDSRVQFLAIYNDFQKSNTLIKKILKTLPSTKQKIETAENLLQVGIEISLLGEKVSQLLTIIQSENDNVIITGKIRAIQSAIDDIKIIESRISNNFLHIDIESLPIEMQDDVALLKEVLPKVFSSLNQVEELVDFAYIIMGGDKQQRYVLIFQNSDELRATGGFIGSLTTATLYQGSVVDIDTPGGGPYDWQAWIDHPTQAPKPLWLVNPVWQFQDANWFADFPTSANKILKFYNQTKPERIDGVIAINSYILPSILALVGDVELPEYDKVLTADNVLYEIQNVVELEYDLEENKPKKIIGDLFDVLLDRLLEDDSVELIDVLDIINTGLLERDIQMYFTDSELQSQARRFQWSGELKQTTGDYLMIVNSNIGGAKTDKFMLQESKLDSFIQPDGSIVNELTIRRTNNGIPGDIFYGHNNVDYIRIYVPKGSELISATGDFESPSEEFFEQPPQDIPVDADYVENIVLDGYDNSGISISHQFGKTVFGGWLQTNLEETSEIHFRYRVPIDPITISTQADTQIIQKLDQLLQEVGIKDENDKKMWYSMYWQKQSGHNNHSVKYTLNFSDKWNLEHAARPGFVTNKNIEYQVQLEQDFSSGFLFGVE